MSKKKIITVVSIISFIIIFVVGSFILFSSLYYHGTIFTGNSLDITKNIVSSVYVYNESGEKQGGIGGFLISPDTVVTGILPGEPNKIKAKKGGESHEMYLYKTDSQKLFSIYKTKGKESLIEGSMPKIYTALTPLKGSQLYLGYYSKDQYILGSCRFLDVSYLNNQKVFMCDHLNPKLYCRPIFDHYGRILGMAQRNSDDTYFMIIPYIDILKLAR